MDGMEVTQFTYMQQAGSLPLTPVPVEITYGLERIIMALQVIGLHRSSPTITDRHPVVSHVTFLAEVY